MISNTDAGETAAPGAFARTVVENIKDHHRYEYFIPHGQDLSRAAALLRQQVIAKGQVDASFVDRHLKVTQVPRGCVPGYVLYNVSVTLLQRRAEAIYDRVLPFINTDGSAPGMARIATLEPASRSYEHYALLDAQQLPTLLKEIGDLRRLSSTKVSHAVNQ